MPVPVPVLHHASQATLTASRATTVQLRTTCRNAAFATALVRERPPGSPPGVFAPAAATGPLSERGVRLGPPLGEACVPSGRNFLDQGLRELPAV
ncbi:hypothetical protein GCM10010172_55230 [Paractinoplanes ferrugineus]